ncbi:hypothetical protein BGK72_15185 [Streptomyces agglomeratus]|nr:hypothetical protein BGK72_15185 [Streptomyces agglomeratus]
MFRPRRTWLPVLAAILMTTALLNAPAASPAQPRSRPAAAAAVATGATFNHPAGTAAEQSRIRDHITGLVNRAAAGTSITVSMYTFTDDTVADALVAAKRRGVSVKVILDRTSVTMTGGEYDTLAAGLGTDRTRPSWVLACPAGRGCVGTRTLPGDADGPINHNKFFLFSSVGGSDPVVVQTSANMTHTQRTNLFNNAVTIVGAGLYDIYRAYFADLLKYGASSGGLSHYYRTPSSGGYKTYFFPRRERQGAGHNNDARTDTVKLILDNVGCAGGTQVRMAANLFTRDEVAKKLVSLKSAGCSVRLAHDGAPRSMSASVERAVSGGLTERVRCYEDRGSGLPRAGLHSKYLLVEGTYAGAAGRRLVFTGSHNYTYPALRSNDETLLKIDNATLFGQYKTNHTRLMSYCKGS